eukprot:TRINITY_DN869_c0_g2_i1.p1 TRINITY_DN869_c0_g2~~TRINITY_DN869_c0_g2_i1.p1  ORF type:complete len:105 (-),score=2.53 TRINITY_DN869_c0_g2_i1:266-580(-)
MLPLLALWIVSTMAIPTVLWHGMGDTCCNPQSMGYIQQIIEQATGDYVFSIKIGDTESDDQWNGFFKNVNTQIDEAHNLFKQDSKLANGFNVRYCSLICAPFTL